MYNKVLLWKLFAAQSVQYILWEIAIQDAVELCEHFNNLYVDGNVICDCTNNGTCILKYRMIN